MGLLYLTLLSHDVIILPSIGIHLIVNLIEASFKWQYVFCQRLH